MKRKFKALSLFLTLSLSTALVFTGCGNTNNSSGNDDKSVAADSDSVVTLKLLHRWTQEPDSTFFNEVAAEYEKVNPNVKIDVQSISNDPFKEKIKVVLGTDEAPDVFFTWPGDFTNRFIRADKIYDLTDELAKDGWGDTFVEAQVEPFKYKDKVYGVPYRLDGKVFVYNKKIFDEVGVSAPNTWDEFIEVCEKIKAAGITPISYGNVAQWASTHYLGTLNQKEVPNDVTLKDYDPESGEFTDPGYVRALEKYSKIISYCNADTNSIKHSEARVNFINEQSAMMFVEIIEFPEIDRAAEEGFEYGVFKFPDIADAKGGNNHLTGYPEGFVVSANTKHPKEAVDFLKFLTGKEMGVKEAEDLGFINGIKNVVGKGVVTDSIYDTTQIVLNAEGMTNWLDSALHAKVGNVYMVNAQKLADGAITPEQFMKEVQEAAKEVRAEMGK
ncbi:ABC transporter substrate-binding protein [Clostridium sediminicola]|uniref:ABC transporter substrate-binding protein n=1 Tax=Clostridium sediminicola TaxID=3114879 RepID=UPI0031F26F3D